ncbi:MAG: PH domain-containing protein [Oscillospiraceae bacterium]|nr:PH domain-containing protein [Oscillospiraceae bacterium]
MAYLESNLGKEEKIISKGEVSFLPLIPSAVFGAIILIFGISAGFGGFIAALIIDAIIILPKFLGIKNTELGLTNKKVMGKYGIINTKVMDSPLNKVNSVTVEQGLGGKIFGYGKVVISTSSGGYNFNYIKSADSFRSAVMNQIDAAEEERLRKQAEQLAGAMK